MTDSPDTPTLPGMQSRKPSHVVGAPGDKRSLCGKGDRHGPALPVVAARHVDMHLRGGYGFTVCADCAAILDGMADPLVRRD